MGFLTTANDGFDYLMHHGVKGMHWGVWNEETRHRYFVNKGLSSDDRTLRKGHKVYRITDNPDETGRRKTGNNFTYVYDNVEDQMTYKGHSDYFAKGSKVYETQLSATKDLQIAGSKKVTEILLKAQGLESEAEKLSKEKLPTNKHLVGYLNKRLGSHDAVYDMFVKADLVGENIKQNGVTAVIDVLKKSGYDGMVDVHDQMVWEGARPMIVFDRHENLKKKKAVEQNG